MTIDLKNNILFNELTSKIDSLIPLPTTISEIMKVTQVPNFTAKDISKIIGKDQAMVSRILKLANSSYYGYQKSINTISHAIVCLGMETVKNLALSASSVKFLKKPVRSYALEGEALFQHSLAVALGSRIIAKKIGYSNYEEVYIMGLLHDIGKLVIDQHASQKFREVILLFYKGGITFLEAEETIMGFNHGTLGAEIAVNWNLGDELIDTIRYHHIPQKAKEDNFSVHIIHVADILAEMIGLGIGVDGLNYEMDSNSLQKLKITDMDDIISNLADEIEQEND